MIVRVDTGDAIRPMWRCDVCGEEYRGSMGIPPDRCYSDQCYVDDSDYINYLPQFEPYYDTGLGEFVRTRGERKRIMREKGLEEIGNDLDSWRKLSANHKPAPICSKEEVAEKLKEIRSRMENDASYRRYYEQR